MQTGTVIKSTGSWYNVRLDNGEVLSCRIVGKFRLNGMNLTNPVAVGDKVEISPDVEGGLIRKILPRRNYVARQSPRSKHDLHLLASNVDQALLISTIVQPNLKPGFIDRFLMMTEPSDIPVIIAFNKADLYGPEEMELYDAMHYIYTDIGYTVLLVSADNGVGQEALVEALRGKVTLVGGQSGVGKSSLVNRIQPQLHLRTKEISDHSGKGQHTTTFAEMMELDFGGSIIDTPGIKTLSFNNLGPTDVAHNFREFFKRSVGCRFGGQCLHRNEPGCAIKAAVEANLVSEVRYENYLNILEEIEAQNYWERHKDM
ncbi:MAG: ribosome small subunit-dependent GTPase A [Saprospiraceae bacterium]